MSKESKERIAGVTVDVVSLAKFLAVLEATGLIHVNRKKLKQS